MKTYDFEFRLQIRLMTSVFTLATLLLSLATVPARAEHHSVSAAGAQQCTNDTGVQLVSILMESPGENIWAECIEFAFFDSAGSATGSFVVTNDPPSGNFNANVGTQRLADTPGGPRIDVVIPAGLESAATPGGTVCYRSSGAAERSDGERCRGGINICQTIAPATCGCDGLPDSGTVADACGVCGGDGSSCATGTCGDVSGDGRVDIVDALIVAQFHVGARDCAAVPAIDFCDTATPPATPDGQCNIVDALRLAQCDVGIGNCTFDCQPSACAGQ